MILVIILFLLIVLYGLLETYNHKKNLKKIDLRIYVNGTRGKSTTTRFIAGGLREAGYSVMAKTTGTEARLIYPDGSEKPLERRGLPRIIEQVRIISEANKMGANIIVMECMALSPEMQWISEHRMVKSHIGVITNVRFDHCDKMGNTLDEIADTLALTIPKNGKLVTSEDKFLGKFENISKTLNTKVYPVNGINIENKKINKFQFPVFKDNIACALKSCELLGVPEKTALQGMYKVKPDPGSLFFKKINIKNKNIFLINAFAANDYLSTKMAWEKWKEWYHKKLFNDIPVIGLYNNRKDRNFRIKELARLSKDINFEKVCVFSSGSFLIKHFFEEYDLEIEFINGSKNNVKNLIGKITEGFEDNILLFGFGNTKDIGLEISSYFIENGKEAIC